MTIQIGVFVNHPECSVESAHGIIRALGFRYNVECFHKTQISARLLDKFDVLAIPGGIGDSNTWHNILQPYADCFLNRLAKGAKYLGICMGAYWAGPYYFNIVKGIEPVQYIKQPGADVKRSFGTVAEISWLGQRTHMYFYDGCALKPTGGKFKTIANYTNGDPAAIIQGNIGLIGPHPESDIYWYSKPYMQAYWHEYYHHELLLDFVNQLVK